MRRLISALAVCLLPVLLAAPASARSLGAVPTPAAVRAAAVVPLEAPTPPAGTSAWQWPRAGARVTAPYVQPPHAYGPGHRGIDIAGSDAAVRAPADGVVAYAGTVGDRGVLTIDHGAGWVSSYEPVGTALAPGDTVAAGDVIAEIQLGGHSAPGSLHLGVRADGEYVNPLLLLGGIPRAVLLPCCEDPALSGS